MDSLIVPILRLINGIFTLAFFPNLYRIYRSTQKRFYLLWGLGFFFYGVNIMIRTSLLIMGIESINAEVFSFMVLLVGFTLIITGIGELINKAKLLLAASMIIPISIIVLYFTSRPYLLGQIIALAPFVFIAVSLLAIRLYYSASLDYLVVGWTLIAITNIGYSFNYITPLYVEVYAIIGKVILYYGSTYSRFSYFAEDLRRVLVASAQTQYIVDPGDRFILINPVHSKRSDEIQWIKNKIDDNSKKAIRTILVTTYDLITPNDLRATNVNEENLYMVRMNQGEKMGPSVFTDKDMIINDDLNDLDILFNDIIAFSLERKITCQIILYNLSSLIHTHGWKRVYTFLLSKVSSLKNSSVYLYAIYYPTTHEEEADIAKFELLADSVNEI